MRTTVVRATGLAAAVLLGVAGLTACSSSSSSSTSSSPAPASSAASPTESMIDGPITAPIMVAPDATTAEAAVGDYVVFDVDKPGDWTIESSDVAVLPVTPGGTSGGATFYPGGIAMAAGKATVTLTDTAGTARKVDVTVAEATQVLPPIMVEESDTTATAKQGDVVVFNVTDPAEWTVTSSDPATFVVTQGSDDGTVVMNPGGLALQDGTVTVTLEKKDGTTRTVEVTIAG